MYIAMLSKKKIEEYKNRLEQEKKRLLEDLKIGEKMLDFGSDVDGGDEEADEAEEIGAHQAVERVLKEKIAAIDAALAKIKNGAYGRCDACGSEIAEKILDAAPESNLCEKCKKA